MSQVLATLADGDTGKTVVVAAQQDHMLVTAFHPELTPDLRWHKYFVNEIVRKNVKKA
jgi:5'-phosphate synthase pdxT subunit